MKRKMNLRSLLFASAKFAPSVLCASLLACALHSAAQAPAQVSPLRGVITAIDGSILTVKTDAGDLRQVAIPATAALLRVAPGAKDLSAAQTITSTDLASGDRVLVKLDPASTGPIAKALRVVVITQSDLAQKQRNDREDWQQRGVGGLVKRVDAASGAIVITSGSGATAKTVTVHTTKATILKRYAQASVRFDAAVPAPIDAIHAGDQLRARGAKNPDGTEIAAEEVVSGSFRNVSGIIGSLDLATTSFVVKDLATKKQLTIHITADAQMRRLPDRMAQMLAARLKGTTSAGANTGNWSGNASSPTPGGGTTPQHSGGGQWAGAQAGGAGGNAGQAGANSHWSGGGQGDAQGGQWAGHGGGDPEQMLNRAPAIQFADLQKGEAVMLVSSDGATDVTAITLLAGVEPLLEAPAASRDLLANWSVGASTPDVAQ
ncbi:MAG: hypothetical protein ABR907_12785 [Terracidiphilus sp.]|jgi:hypothetical protein